jgi:hypothetical protein
MLHQLRVQQFLQASWRIKQQRQGAWWGNCQQGSLQQEQQTAAGGC